ncbi:EnvZ/OmpR regulon moderator MzrA [Dickeya lacustris]|uniref:Modulator protein MzrA n=1 Tax=Dickeya lacustris TaxID=2259638 RepID=A0ABY8GBI4_9GAMM|nr:EnvZ/OmpR regulon moderator MzrA [Dickeya lacustris]WFN57277.1 EnvZ/OmpR regulon moderator MzrA [Dickeya lacustris]
MPFARMLRPLWRLLVLLLPLAALLTTSSQHLPDEVMLHITARHQGTPLPDGFYIYQRLNEHGIAIKSITPEHDSIIVRLSSPEQSGAAREVLRIALPQALVIAQRINPALPEGQS